mmetsp:Transcript_6852/g.22022  ORF Transcript_6852/g.22022 Transcript_6852/m.22022 type:complete len:238 (+) Transcript_6852:450-1163(+)
MNRDAGGRGGLLGASRNHTWCASPGPTSAFVSCSLCPIHQPVGRNLALLGAAFQPSQANLRSALSSLLLPLRGFGGCLRFGSTLELPLALAKHSRHLRGVDRLCVKRSSLLRIRLCVVRLLHSSFDHRVEGVKRASPRRRARRSHQRLTHKLARVRLEQRRVDDPLLLALLALELGSGAAGVSLLVLARHEAQVPHGGGQLLRRLARGPRGHQEGVAVHGRLHVLLIDLLGRRAAGQ